MYSCCLNFYCEGLIDARMSSEKTWSGQMRMREVLVVVVAATVFLLPYLLVYQRPSLDQLVEAVSQKLSSASTRWEPKVHAEPPPPVS